MFRIRSPQYDRLESEQVGNYLARDLAKAFGEARYSPEKNSVLYGRGSRQGRLQLDDKGRVARSVTPLGRITSFRFENDRLQTQQTSAGVVTTFGSDAAGNVSSMRHDQSSQRLEFDGNGDLLRQTFPDGTSMRYERDQQRRLLRLVDRAGTQTRWSYTEDGLLASVVDPRGHATRFEYTDWDLPTRVLHPSGTIEEFDYGANQVKRRVGGAPHSERSVDDQGRPTSIRYADGHEVEFVFNEHGKVTRAKSAAAVTECKYDDGGRVVLDKTGLHAVSCEYQEGNLSRITLPDDSSVAYEYDADDRLSAVVDWTGRRQQFAYGTSEQPVARQLPNGLIERYMLDDVDHLRTVELAATDGTKWRQSYAFDLMDRLVVREDSLYGPEHFEYDAAGQLTAVRDSNGQPLESFAYDEAGNRHFASGRFAAYDAGDRAIRDDQNVYAFDARGNRTSAQSAGATIEYVYDFRDLLVAVIHADGARTDYSYDAFSRRIEKRCGSVVTEYVWAGQQMVQEIVTDGEHRHTREFLYWPGQHRPLAMRSRGRVYYYHCDRLGTPQLLSDELGTIVWSARYEAYGSARVDTRKVEQPLRFVGQYFDDETGLHYNTARYYDPALGCYLSADPVVPACVANSYRYAAGNPVNLSDPLGLFGESWPGWARAAAGLAAGAAVVVAAIVLAPATLTVGAAIALTLGVGALAGAVGFGVTAALTPGACFWCEVGKGAVLGAIGAIPFVAAIVAAPALLAYTGTVMALGGLGGALSYGADCVLFGHPWDTKEFLATVVLSALTAGLFKALGGKIAGLRGGGAKPTTTKSATESTTTESTTAKGQEPAQLDPLRPLEADTSKGPYPAFAEARQRVADMPGTPQEKAEAMRALIDRLSKDPDLGWRADEMPTDNAEGLWLGDKNGLGMAVDPTGRVMTTNPKAVPPEGSSASPFMQGTNFKNGKFVPDFDAVDANGNKIWRETPSSAPPPEVVQTAPAPAPTPAPVPGTRPLVPPPPPVPPPSPGGSEDDLL